MASVRSRRKARVHLKAHDRGDNRHNKDLNWWRKRDRKRVEYVRTRNAAGTAK